MAATTTATATTATTPLASLSTTTTTSYTGNDDDGAKVPQGEGYKFLSCYSAKSSRSTQLSGFDSFEFLAKFRRQKSRQFCR